MPLAVFGKHPAKGDFLEAGLPPALLTTLESWLDSALADLRETLGAEWPATWAKAPQLRFWLGEAIWGSPIAGVMAPTQDRVGRRFPLILLVSGPDAPPPPITYADPPDDWHDQAAAHLTAALARPDFARPADLLQGAPLPTAPEGITAPTPGDFWAVQPGPHPQALWSDVTATDHRRAASTRSYWWVAGEEASPDIPESEIPESEIPEPAEKSSADGESLAAELPAELPALENPTPDTASLWDAPDNDDTASPFDAPGAGLGLFAPPEPGGLEPAPAALPTPPARTLAPRAPLWSQVWAGDGLPSGNVLAWLLRGHVAHD